MFATTLSDSLLAATTTTFATMPQPTAPARPASASIRCHDDVGADVFEELDVDLYEDPERWDGLA